MVAVCVSAPLLRWQHQPYGGDWAYNKWHEDGHCKAKRIPFGALVDYLPTPRPGEKKEAFEPKTNRGLLVGYFVWPGDMWSGNYLVADFEQLRQHPDSQPSRCSIHPHL